jgi:hypothetical protein
MAMERLPARKLVKRQPHTGCYTHKARTKALWANPRPKVAAQASTEAKKGPSR